MWYKLKRIMIRPNGVEKQVRPSGWQPWANTIAYYPLTSISTVNDMKGSWVAYDLTNNGDVTFWTYDWIDCAKFWWTQNTSCLYYNSSLFTWSAEFTVNIWHKQLSTYSWSHNNILGVWTYLWTNWFIEWVKTNNSHLFVWWWTNDRDTWYVMPVWTWQNIVYTHKNWNIKVYVDGVLKYTGTVSFTIWNWKTILWWWIISWDVSVDNMQWYLSNVIFESVEWTAQEIADYYDRTKANYWIS